MVPVRAVAVFAFFFCAGCDIASGDPADGEGESEDGEGEGEGEGGADEARCTAGCVDAADCSAFDVFACDAGACVYVGCDNDDDCGDFVCRPSVTNAGTNDCAPACENDAGCGDTFGSFGDVSCVDGGCVADGCVDDAECKDGFGDDRYVCDAFDDEPPSCVIPCSVVGCDEQFPALTVPLVCAFDHCRVDTCAGDADCPDDMTCR